MSFLKLNKGWEKPLIFLALSLLIGEILAPRPQHLQSVNSSGLCDNVLEDIECPFIQYMPHSPFVLNYWKCSPQNIATPNAICLLLGNHFSDHQNCWWSEKWWPACWICSPPPLFSHNLHSPRTKNKVTKSFNEAVHLLLLCVGF